MIKNISVGRPRKNRVGEYASHLVEEITHQLKQELAREMAEHQKLYQEEVNALRVEIKRLSKQLDVLKKRQGKTPRIGKWVPGGPGRPPKDAAERIAAFKQKTKD